MKRRIAFSSIPVVLVSLVLLTGSHLIQNGEGGFDPPLEELTVDMTDRQQFVALMAAENEALREQERLIAIVKSGADSIPKEELDRRFKILGLKGNEIREMKIKLGLNPSLKPSWSQVDQLSRL